MSISPASFLCAYENLMCCYFTLQAWATFRKPHAEINNPVRFNALSLDELVAAQGLLENDAIRIRRDSFVFMCAWLSLVYTLLIVCWVEVSSLLRSFPVCTGACA